MKYIIVPVELGCPSQLTDELTLEIMMEAINKKLRIIDLITNDEYRLSQWKPMTITPANKSGIQLTSKEMEQYERNLL